MIVLEENFLMVQILMIHYYNNKMKYFYNKNTQTSITEGNSFTYRISPTKVFSGIPTVEQLLSWGFEEVLEDIDNNN